MCVSSEHWSRSDRIVDLRDGKTMRRWRFEAPWLSGKNSCCSNAAARRPLVAWRKHYKVCREKIAIGCPETKMDRRRNRGSHQGFDQLVQQDPRRRPMASCCSTSSIAKLQAWAPCVLKLNASFAPPARNHVGTLDCGPVPKCWVKLDHM